MIFITMNKLKQQQDRNISEQLWDLELILSKYTNEEE